MVSLHTERKVTKPWANSVGPRRTGLEKRIGRMVCDDEQASWKDLEADPHTFACCKDRLLGGPPLRHHPRGPAERPCRGTDWSRS